MIKRIIFITCVIEWPKTPNSLNLMLLEKSYLHQNGVELNFLFIVLASRPATNLRINPRIRADSKGVSLGGISLTIIDQHLNLV